MAHGYLGDGYGMHRDNDLERDDDRAGDRDREWRGENRRNRDRDRGAMFGGTEERRSPSANPDDHYLSWRNRHMSELDRDYADYCREREQQFHHDFDAWRRVRHGNPEPLRPGMTQTGISQDPEGDLELLDPAKMGQYEEDPMATATLGTNSTTGRKLG